MEDPERVIAEALRAQAARTPLPSAEATQVNAAPGLGLAGSGYGLLSGSDLALSLPTAPIESPTEAVGTRRIERERRGGGGGGAPRATPLWLMCVLLSVCAFIGNVSGYWIGAKAGPALFNKPDSRLFKREHVERTHAFFEKYGARAIILARFVPIVRTFITAIAGVGRMDPRRFFVYSAIGGGGGGSRGAPPPLHLRQIALFPDPTQPLPRPLVLAS